MPILRKSLGWEGAESNGHRLARRIKWQGLLTLHRLATEGFLACQSQKAYWSRLIWLLLLTSEGRMSMSRRCKLSRTMQVSMRACSASALFPVCITRIVGTYFLAAT